ncbi:MAG: hypothetical protein ACR2PS_13555 [Pseudomonadales bacterium]
MSGSPTERNPRTIRWLTYLMFMMFTMTIDAVGVIIGAATVRDNSDMARNA